MHLTDYVQNLVDHCDNGMHFIPIARPPYKPRVAPIKYMFCKVSMDLQRQVWKHWNFNKLRNGVHNSLLTVGRDGKLNNTFAHCGY